MSKITIPPAALEAGAEAFLECDRSPACSFEDALRAAIAAALNAWPGMSKVGEVYGLQQEWWLELPLPQEASDNDGQPDEVQEWNDYDPDC